MSPMRAHGELGCPALTDRVVGFVRLSSGWPRGRHLPRGDSRAGGATGCRCTRDVLDYGAADGGSGGERLCWGAVRAGYGDDEDDAGDEDELDVGVGVADGVADGVTVGVADGDELLVEAVGVGDAELRDGVGVGVGVVVWP